MPPAAATKGYHRPRVVRRTVTITITVARVSRSDDATPEKRRQPQSENRQQTGKSITKRASHMPCLPMVEAMRNHDSLSGPNDDDAAAKQWPGGRCFATFTRHIRAGQRWTSPMRTKTLPFRLVTALTVAALLGGLRPNVAGAQPTPDPNQSDPAQSDQGQIDPPTRVGRLARVTGTVSYHTRGDSQWTPAAMNFPVASGSSFWTEPRSGVELEFSGSRIALAGGSEIDIGTLDASGLQATLTQGEAILRPRALADGESWTLVTPRGTLTTSHPGRIIVRAGDTEAPTRVSVLEGEARIIGPGLDQALTAGQTASITGTDSLQATLEPAGPDSFANEVQQRERPPVPPPARMRPVPPPPMIASIPGGEELAGYGAWGASPDYGEVWYPRVDAGWVPYRQGHWAFIAPWGWTWVDDAPWGFAPFHYGRWVQLYGRWAWTPGFDHERGHGYPVYAPALVAFVGLGVGVTIGAAFATRSIGWIPLGPREPFRPWYHASPRYLSAVNGPRVTTITNITTTITNVTNFRNRTAGTMVPASAMTASRPIRSLAQPISAGALAGARPFVGQHPVSPTLATAGVTQSVARQMNLTSGATGVAPRPAAVGPPIGLQTLAPLAAGSAPSRPALQSPSPAFSPSLRGGFPGTVSAPLAGGGAQPLGPSAPAGSPLPGNPRFAAPPISSPSGAPPLGSAPPASAPVPQLPRPGAPPVPQANAPSAQTPRFAAPAPQGNPRPMPQVNAPAPQGAPPQQFQPSQPAVVQRPSPQFTAPPPMVQRPPPQFTAPPPMVQRPPPQVAAPPPRAAAPPVQQFQPPQPHFQAPPPQFQPAPAAAPSPRPAPAPQQQRQKRPGEP